MVDIAPLEGDPVEDYKAIRRELAQYSQVLAEKPQIVVANKMDLTGSDQNLQRFAREIGVDVIPISGVTGKGLDALTQRIWELLHPQED
jgi:GTP-binding protein